MYGSRSGTLWRDKEKMGWVSNSMIARCLIQVYMGLVSVRLFRIIVGIGLILYQAKCAVVWLTGYFFHFFLSCCHFFFKQYRKEFPLACNCFLYTKVQASCALLGASEGIRTVQ